MDCFYHFTEAEEQTFVFKSHNINKPIKTYFLKLSYFNVIILNVTVLIWYFFLNIYFMLLS